MSASSVGELIAKARASAKLQERLEAFLGETAAAHFSLVSQSPRDLVLLADSPVWNSYLRFRVPMILEHLRVEYGMRSLADIHIKVAIPEQGAAFSPNKPAKLSPRSAAYLRRVAESTADPDLKSIYERIGSRGGD